MLQHGLVKRELYIQDLVEIYLTGVFQPVGAFKCEWKSTADMVQSAGQIEGAGTLAAFGLDFEKTCVWQTAFGQELVALISQQSNSLLDFCGDVCGTQNSRFVFMTVKGDRQIRAFFSSHLQDRWCLRSHGIEKLVVHGVDTLVVEVATQESNGIACHWV